MARHGRVRQTVCGERGTSRGGAGLGGREGNRAGEGPDWSCHASAETRAGFPALGSRWLPPCRLCWVNAHAGITTIARTTRADCDSPPFHKERKFTLGEQQSLSGPSGQGACRASVPRDPGGLCDRQGARVYLSPSCPSRSRFNVGGLSRAVDTSSPQEIANHLGMKEGARHRSGAACTSGLLPLLGAIRNLVMTSPTWWVSRCAATRSRTRWRSPRLAAGIQRDGFAPQERKLKGPRIRRGP